MTEKHKILTVGDGDLTLSLALARAYSDHVSLTASILDCRNSLLKSFPDAPLQELAQRDVDIRFNVDATQLHEIYPKNHWDLVIFHHPHLGLASLSHDEANHANRHFQLLCHYFYSAMQVAKRVHVCLCGTQPETWQLFKAASLQNLQMQRQLSTSAPFSKIWTDEGIRPCDPEVGHAAPRRYRNGKLGSRHFLGKYGYRHRRTAGEQYIGGSSDMNVAGSTHYIFTQSSQTSVSESTVDDQLICSVCGATFESSSDMIKHLRSPARPLVAELTNLQKTVHDCSSNTRKSNSVEKEEAASVLETSPLVSIDKIDVNRDRTEMIVRPEHDQKRLRWFVQHNTDASKRKAEDLIQGGSVYVDGIQALDSSRILRSNMKIFVSVSSNKTEIDGTIASKARIDILFRYKAIIVVEKAVGMRTKGHMQGTLEEKLSKQEGIRYESLSKLDTSCGGLCVLRPENCANKNLDKPRLQHHMIALIHGSIPEKWHSRFEVRVPILRKWKRQKVIEGEDTQKRSSEELTDISIVPMEGPSGDEKTDQSSILISTIQIQTSHPSSASICQWMRRLGCPVVGDMNCRKEYLQLKRAIRNRIKNKVSILSHRVQWYDASSEETITFPIENPPIPPKLSYNFWKNHFGTSDELRESA